MERIGIYGGTFNPPHTGHMCAARCAVERLALDKLLLIPSNISPHKILPAGSPTPRQRLEMLRIAAKDIPAAQVSDIELQRGGTSYTYQTLQQLKDQYPDSELVLLMGTDMFLSLLHWRQPETILSLASVGVFYRGNPEEEEKIRIQQEELQRKGAKVYLVNNPVTEISSTDLRRLLSFDCASPYLPTGVGDYIRENKLYSAAGADRNLPEQALEQRVKELLKESRIAHVLGCRDTAVELAKRWGANEEDAARAALLHDVTKALSPALQLTLCREYGIVLDAFFQDNPKTLHALTGSLVAQRIFGENEAVVEAIRWHTTGKANMNTLEKIIYVADYMEPNRDFPGVEALRSLAYEDIDKALKLGLEMTLRLLTQQKQQISSGSREALDYLEKCGV